MKTIPIAATLMTICAATAHAASFTSPPVPLDETSELLIMMVNTCATRADYSVVIRNASSSAVVFEKEGVLGAGRGTALPFSWGVNQTVTGVYHTITWDCRGTTQRPPMLSFAVRDLETRVPRFVGLLGDTGTHE